jgi:hypothetical protein
MCSAIAPIAPVMRISLPERSMWIMVVISVLGAFYMIPCFSNAATALLPSSRAFLTSFSPRAFSSAFVKACVASYSTRAPPKCCAASTSDKPNSAARSSLVRSTRNRIFYVFHHHSGGTSVENIRSRMVDQPPAIRSVNSDPQALAKAVPPALPPARKARKRKLRPLSSPWLGRW